jgi:UDP-N-acetylmuramate dehydrogenase
MNPDLTILHNFPLGNLNSFGIDAHAQSYLRITSMAQLQALRCDTALQALPHLVLGGGSNILLTQDFNGLVLHMANTGIDIVTAVADSNDDDDDDDADVDAYYVRAAAGENWHDLVLWTLDRDLSGLENLALIPGTVGAAPIQNIGAYGVEVGQYVHSVSAFDSASGKVVALNRAACRFGYRDSIFKHAEGRRLVILDVTFALPKRWQPHLRYAELAKALHGNASPDARTIADAVTAIRRAKLPDPAVIGNAGSFFKNPVVSKDKCLSLLENFPTLVHHAQDDGSEKLAAGWLIDQCGWKGKRLGRAGVYPKQALVLVNNGGASGTDIVALASAIQADVLARYDVMLEPEPVFI